MIPPWNFPCAIMAGHDRGRHRLRQYRDPEAFAAIRRPSRRSSLKSLQEAGLPDGVVNFCPGSGATLWQRDSWSIQRRVTSPSPDRRKSGWTSTSAPRKPQPGQIWIKRTVLEMGGKDSIIVDADANLDAAVEGVAQAAFGFSRAKMFGLLARHRRRKRFTTNSSSGCASASRRSTVGDPAENPRMGPVVNEKRDEVASCSYIEIGKKEGRLITGGGPAREAGDGYYIQPTVIADVAPTARFAGRDFRPGAGGDQVAQLRRSAGDRQQH